MNLKTSLALIPVLLLLSISVNAQQPLEVNKTYKDLRLTKGDTLSYSISLVKNGIFNFTIEQQGMALVYDLLINGRSVMKSKRPDDVIGILKSEYTPFTTGRHVLKIYRYADPENTDSGKLSIFISSLSAMEVARRQQIKKELAPENAKPVLTLDVDHFWQAFDRLKQCNSFADSVNAFRSLYLDRATDGLVDYISVRELTAEKLVKAVARYPRFYASVRNNTTQLKSSAVAISQLFDRFRALYPNFKPFKVCFVIGMVNSGGTVSDRFVLIGSEIIASTQASDVSEFVKEKNTDKVTLLSQKEGLLQKVRNIVAHECVHTQQRPLASGAEKCPLLYQVLKEGSCDFIGELVAGQQINVAAHTYGDSNEGKLWKELSTDLCSPDLSRWLYNAGRVKGTPADLGYYMGYRIARSYYQQATDKRQAIIDIIEMDNPKRFLQLSKYQPNTN
jgi:hypothetical protein